MKKHGILNSEIAKVLADLGHMDQITIGDAGLPVPDGIPKIDLALALSDPPFQKVLALVLGDMIVEKMFLATEIQQKNPTQLVAIQQVAPEIPIDYVSHEEFKKQMAHSKVVIRTGEATPFSNVILQAGVIF
ncbi:D-ribose pyranase [Carnobacterium gallinarum]|uniref:D-ribose pyranase n=1 Tax=Carnobacterium gallinarum TaxID=2749 RepID=UPI00054FA9C7|nr:D-ribose pyranase [Carnobacterium gallinarum]